MSTNTQAQARIVAIFGGEGIKCPEAFEKFLLGMEDQLEEICPEKGKIQIVGWNPNMDFPSGEIFIFPTSLVWNEAIKVRDAHKSARIVVLTDKPEYLKLSSDEVGIITVPKDLFVTNRKRFFGAILGIPEEAIPED